MQSQERKASSFGVKREFPFGTMVVVDTLEENGVGVVVSGVDPNGYVQVAWPRFDSGYPTAPDVGGVRIWQLKAAE